MHKYLQMKVVKTRGLLKVKSVRCKFAYVHLRMFHKQPDRGKTRECLYKNLNDCETACNSLKKIDFMQQHVLIFGVKTPL